MDICSMYNNAEEIRFLPNSNSDFPKYEDFYNFLTQKMKERNGRYNYPGQAMRCRDNTLVFFQYRGTLVASAFLLDTVRGKCYDESGNEYAGHYIFDMNTMVIYNPPITCEQIKAIDPKFTGFSQCKRKVDISLKSDLLNIISNNSYSAISTNK